MTLKEKVDIAIERLRMFEPPDEPYYLCYSGGKDSDAIRILAELAGVRHEIHHNLTTVDAPETIQYIKSIPNVIIDKAHYTDRRDSKGNLLHKTMWNLIPLKGMPPTRLLRYCCAELKEVGGKGKLKITGVRWEESTNRQKNSDFIKIIGKPKTTMKMLDENGIEYKVSDKGGILLDYDNEILRDDKDIMQHCYRTRQTTINPIVDWTESDVWEFLRYYGCSGNPLYQCGKGRIGCIGCPMQGKKAMKSEFVRYPKYYENYIRAFDKLVKRLNEKNGCTWKTGEEVMKWWISDEKEITGQIAFDGFNMLDI